MSEATNREGSLSSDEDLKRAVIASLDALGRDGKLAVLEYSRNLEKRENPNLGAMRLLDEWAAEEPSYDQETLSELKKALDRDRLGYRKLFE